MEPRFSILKVFDMTVAVPGSTNALPRLLGFLTKGVYLFALSCGLLSGRKEHVHQDLYAPRTGRILGAQIVGFDGVDKRCDVLATAISFPSSPLLT